MNIGKIFKIGGAGLVMGMIALLLSWVLFESRLGKTAEDASFNLLFLPRSQIPVREAAIVFMDDDSYDRLNQSYIAPWDRRLHAKLVDRLTKAGAKAIVFDILFSDPMTNNAGADDAFAKSIKDSGKVILGADWVRGGRDTKVADKVNGDKVIAPFDLLNDAANDIGLAELGTDADLFVRQHFVGEPKDLVFSLSWAAAALVNAPITSPANKAEKFKSRWLNYYGKPGWIPNTEYYRVVSDDIHEQPEDWGMFSNRVVFVGAKITTYNAGERKDVYASPYAYMSVSKTTDKFMPGVEIHATEFLNLVRQDWLTRGGWRWEMALTVCVAAALGIFLPQMKPQHSLPLVGAVIVGVFYVSYWVFVSHRLIWPWMILVEVLAVVELISAGYSALNLTKAKAVMENSLAMYVSPKQVKKIASKGKMLKPGAEKQEVSILFSDIANFTSFSEGMDSDQLANMMNNYFEMAVGRCIHPAQGTVVKFIGDAIFAIWNAPEPQTNHQELACRGALLLKDSVNDFKAPKEGVEVRTRIGLHCGPANVGNFGSSTRIDYTAIGENINLASRMEGLNKYLGTDVLITGDIYNPVREKFTARLAGRFRLKGFEKAVEVFELIGGAEKFEANRGWIETYAAGLACFQKGDWEGAESRFQGTLAIKPNDGPSKFMIKTMAETRAASLPPGWDGVVVLHEK